MVSEATVKQFQQSVAQNYHEGLDVMQVAVPLLATAIGLIPPEPSWGPWIECDGGCPVEGGTEIQIRFANGETSEEYGTTAGEWDWDEEGPYRIVAYRTLDVS